MFIDMVQPGLKELPLNLEIEFDFIDENESKIYYLNTSLPFHENFDKNILK